MSKVWTTKIKVVGTVLLLGASFGAVSLALVAPLQTCTGTVVDGRTINTTCSAVSTVSLVLTVGGLVLFIATPICFALSLGWKLRKLSRATR